MKNLTNTTGLIVGVQEVKEFLQMCLTEFKHVYIHPQEMGTNGRLLKYCITNDSVDIYC